MGETSKIEWTDATWSPIRARWIAPTNDGGGKERVGWHCEHVSEGCRNCYAESINLRLGTQLEFKPGNLFRQDRVGYNNGSAKLFLDEAMLTAPLRLKRPRRIFVCSMTDLFADFVPDEMIDRMFAIMALSPQHVFQILTKRPARMRKYINGNPTRRMISPLMKIATAAQGSALPETWPLPNVWLGVSAEDQTRADERIPDLLATPAAVRFVSAEPLLAAIDFTIIACPHGCKPPEYCNCCYQDGAPATGTFDSLAKGVDLMIVGGESGPRARPMHPRWARNIRDQCAAAGVAFHFKQHGAWLFEDQVRDGQHPGARFFTNRGEPIDERPPFGPPTGRLWHWWEDGGFASIRLGKKAAGRLLDGVLHDGMPEARA